MKVKKTTPKIRWHLSDTERKEIARLSREGMSQTAIAKTLHVTRNTVCKALVKANLPTRTPLLHQETILALLQEGIARRQIARQLKVSIRKVFEFARANGFGMEKRPPLSAEQRAKLVDDIHHRRDSALRLANKYQLPYKQVLLLAHSELECERFLPSKTNPLSSNFPQKHLNYPVNDGQTRRYLADVSA